MQTAFPGTNPKLGTAGPSVRLPADLSWAAATVEGPGVQQRDGLTRGAPFRGKRLSEGAGCMDLCSPVLAPLS